MYLSSIGNDHQDGFCAVVGSIGVRALGVERRVYVV